MPTAVYRLEVAGPVRLLTVLYPTRPGEACPIQAVEAGADVDETSIRLQLADGTTIHMSEGDSPLRG